MKTLNLKLKDNSGFTLIEIMVALFILGIALAAMFAVLVSNSNSATTVKNNYTASLLAQEGMEIVRNLRDVDWLNETEWGSSESKIPDCSPCSVQYNSTKLETGAQWDSFLKLDSATGIYSYDNGQDTIFKRKIDISTEVDSIERKVFVTVSWYDKNIFRSINAEERLFNYK
jgi:prepilin-type N-terminal cleavage/methylation domain-containing protein